MTNRFATKTIAQPTTAGMCYAKWKLLMSQRCSLSLGAKAKLVLAIAIAEIFTIHVAHAQTPPATCPGRIISPLQRLIGTWTFSSNGFAQSASVPASLAPVAWVGSFTAQIATDLRSGQQTGTLTVTRTANLSGRIVRLETDIGRFQVYPDCSGGNLVLNLSTAPVEYEFVFNNDTTLRLVNTGGNSGANNVFVLSGLATRLTDDETVLPSPRCMAACIGDPNNNSCNRGVGDACLNDCRLKCLL
jgi:hypothetical protein